MQRLPWHPWPWRTNCTGCNRFQHSSFSDCAAIQFGSLFGTNVPCYTSQTIQKATFIPLLALRTWFLTSNGIYSRSIRSCVEVAAAVLVSPGPESDIKVR